MTQKSDFFHHLRHPSGTNKLADQLFPGTQWYTHGVLGLEQKAVIAPITAPLEQKTEKGRALESLKEFAQKKIEDSPEAKVVFPGGEIGLKEGASLGKHLHITVQAQLPTWAKSKVKVIFYGEASKLGHDPSDTRAVELLDKMVTAMRLHDSDVIKLMDGAADATLDDLALGLWTCKPQFVVTLGAGATNALLGRKEKLTRIHGQFFPLTLSHEDEQHVAQLMPLFHPDFLLINPNMKRTAWIDLQKIMSELGLANA